MKVGLLAIAACGSAAPAPVVSNTRAAPPAAAKTVTCGSIDSIVRCFATHEACAAELDNCEDVTAPHWTCARSTSTGMIHGTIDLCLPSEELCKLDPAIPEEHREPCRPVPDVYCRGTTELNCHPTRAICEQEVVSLVSFGGDPSACVRYD